MNESHSLDNTEQKNLVAKLRTVDKSKIRPCNKLMILVSVGKENFNQEAMMAIVTLLNEVQINNSPLMFVFNVADSLQRFNMIDDKNSAEQLLTQSIANGSKWLESVNTVLTFLSGSKRIIRWEYWKNHKNYEEACNKILKLEQDYPEEFKRSMSISVNEYVERKKHLLSEEAFSFSEQKHRKYCEQYLLEEIICMVLWKETGCNFILYPGRITPIMSFILEKLIHPTQPELLQWLTIRLQRVYNNYASLKAKQFLFMEKVIGSTLGNIYWKDKNGIYLGCNDNQAKVLGYGSGKEIIGKTDFDLPWKKQAAFLRKIDLEVMENKQTYFVEEPVFINGKIRVFLSKKEPVENEQGQSIGIIGISIDITERKNIEKLQEGKTVLEQDL